MPPFEASDELWHFGVIQHIADTAQLPVQVVGEETIWEQEGSQPPLYYLLAAALVRGIDRSDFDRVTQPNPHAQAGQPGVVGNKNLVLHDSPHPAWQGTILAMYVVRLMSIVLGVVTVCAVYASAHVLQPNQPIVALLAAGLTAFNPMFLFITASVNNDNLVIALNSVVIWQMLGMLRDGFSFRRSVLIAMLIALASLTKLSGLVLLPALVVVALWKAYQTRNWRGLMNLGGLTVAAWGLIAGWWYARNLTLYGELFGTSTMANVAGVRDMPFTFATLVSEFEGFRIAYWGWFGAVNILTVPVFYIVMDIVTILGIVGLLVFVWKNRNNPNIIIRIVTNTLIILAGMVGVLAWTAQTYASQGRLLFPYIAATSSLLALGLITLRQRTSLIVVPLAIFATIVPFTDIIPAYASPTSRTDLPYDATQVYARFGDMELIGYETPLTRYQPGDNLSITVYWRVLQPSSRDFSLWLHAVDPYGNEIGKVDSYPGGGTLRTSTWQPGIYSDSYAIPLSKDAVGRFPLRIQVGWWHYPTEVLIDAIGQSGESLTSVMLDAGAFVAPEPMQNLENVSEANETVIFGDVISLKGYFFEDDNLALLWEATGTPVDNYTVFVQVLDSENQLKGQGDAPPELPTHYWRAGEQFITQHTLTYPDSLPAGSYRVIIGWYRPSDFARLDTNHPDDAYTLIEFNVSE